MLSSERSVWHLPVHYLRSGFCALCFGFDSDPESQNDLKTVPEKRGNCKDLRI